MPHFLFTFEPAAAGCVARVCLETPWNQPQANPQTGQVISPQQAALGYLQQQAQMLDAQGQPQLMFTPGCKVVCNCINPVSTGRAPMIYCIQKAEPIVDRQQFNAPYGTPLANGHSLTMPPIASKENAVSLGGMYETLHDSALATTSDPIMGEMDGAAGTYTDIDSLGREVPRQMMMPLSQKVAGR